MVKTPNYDLDIDSTLGGSNASDYIIPSQKAVKDYVDNHSGGSPQWGSITGTLSNQADLQNALNAKQGTLTFDSTPTSGSSNPVTSGGIYTALSAKADDSAVVKLTGNQTVAGIKTFTDNVVVGNVSPLFIARSTKTTRGAYNSSQGENKVVFRDKDNKLLSEMRTYIESSDSATSLCLAAVTEDTNGNQIYKTFFRGTVHKNGTSEVQLSGDAIYGVTQATSDNSTKIATTAFVKNQGYVTTSALNNKQDTLVSGTNIKTVNGNSLLGNGDLTIGAQVPWGNVTGTLSNQTDLQNALNAKANDSAVVKLTGNQTIAGTKTFSSSPILPTPASSDNSTKAATTAYFRNNMQVVTALPASPTAGVFYFVKE